MFFFQGKGKMNTYWLIGHKNYSVQNDSLVCHWNPNISRKKKPPAGSDVRPLTQHMCSTVYTVHHCLKSQVFFWLSLFVLQSSAAGDSMAAVSRPDVLPQPQGSEVTLRVSAQVERCAGSLGTLGSMVGALQGAEESTAHQHNDKSSLLPGSVTHSWCV